MTGSIFEDWVKKLDRKYLPKDYSIVLVIDNCPAHPAIEGLKAIPCNFGVPPAKHHQRATIMRPGNHSSNKNRLLETRLKESDRCDRDRENSRLCDQRDECSRCNDDSLRLLGMTSVSRPSQTVSDTLVSRPIYKLQKQQTANCQSFKSTSTRSTTK
ncbi:hypothetical protein RRG08_007755 [Elysia crispata]|uniref:DDE-1 domain-containing protein n=1 Tax=Elysia crispata TaxID=231223 RepID=A0AAE0ZF74_9GAST|nr:hypothetical protein RRG08_007755 [Elysia crispata]